MLWPKKNSYKEFDNEKKFLRLENSPTPTPHNLSSSFVNDQLKRKSASFLLLACAYWLHSKL